MLGIPSALFIILFNILKSTEKALPVDLLRYDGITVLFYMKVPSEIVYPLIVGDLFNAYFKAESIFRYQLYSH